jgi:hypothetical protein
MTRTARIGGRSRPSDTELGAAPRALTFVRKRCPGTAGRVIPYSTGEALLTSRRGPRRPHRCLSPEPGAPVIRTVRRDQLSAAV